MTDDPAFDLAAHNDAAVALFTKLDPGAIALLLDFDGTLVDIAPRPDAVHVPQALCDTLERLLQRTSGALALVSGRPIRDLDKFFSPLLLPAVGGHGAEMRLPTGETLSAVPHLPEKLRLALAEARALDPGILIEDKGYSMALHYRGAPHCEEAVRQLIADVLARFAGETVEVLPGKALFEVKRPGVSKGQSVRALMGHRPYAGRKPVFIGDDVTDESVFAMLPEFDGRGFSVQRQFAGVCGIFESPRQVLRALQALATR